MEQLSGLTALVTGGGAGIGRSICLAFANEGMNVVVADREEERAREVAAEVEGTGVKALALTCDVGDAASVEAMADKAYEAFGAVNVLVNNAGILQMGPVADAPQEDWDWLFHVNLWGVVNGVRTFVPRMRAQGSPAHIVNTSSLSGVFAVPGLGVYTAAKYGVMAICETLRDELKPEGIGVSVLCPGPTRSRIGETARITGLERVSREEADLGYLGYKEPDWVAAQVVAGVKANRLYIFSHKNGRITTEKRFNEMLEAFDVLPDE